MPRRKHKKLFTKSWDGVFWSDGIKNDVFFQNSKFLKNNMVVLEYKQKKLSSKEVQSLSKQR